MAKGHVFNLMNEIAVCINIDVTWSDAKRTLSVNTALFKEFAHSSLLRNCDRSSEPEVE